VFNQCIVTGRSAKKYLDILSNKLRSFRSLYEITCLFSVFRYGPLCRLRYYNVTVIVDDPLIVLLQ
jgi:hypothetical protein